LGFLNKDMTTRRDALKSMFKGAGYLAVGGMVWGEMIQNAMNSPLTLRPPGALPENQFTKACVKCGICVEACPYDTLKLAQDGENRVVGTPYFEPREVPCYMCTDIPCVPVCPSGALDVSLVSMLNEQTQKQELDINKSQMGVAIVNKESCVAFWGIQCDACYRACPLMGNAIYLDYEKNERTGKHANLTPVVNGDVCTGCGLCEHACITEKAAIMVLPRAIATGAVGDHYIKGWDKKDEERLNNSSNKSKKDSDVDSAVDYLNSSDDLFDDE
jgi:ferredoxin-type protein NapG